MGKIEEVTDDELLTEEKTTGKDKKNETAGNDKEDDQSEDEVDEEAEDDDDDDDDDGEEIDFTKSFSKEELLGDIQSYNRPPPASCDTCEDCDAPDGNEEGDFFEESPSSGSKSIGSRRAIALMFIFPMLVSGGYMVYEVFGRFKLGKSSMQFTAAIGGALIALVIMSNVKQLKSAVKFVCCFAWIIFLYPTYQVYRCSPVPLKNDMLGTWFSLKTEAVKFSELSYTTSECFRSYQFHSPYLLSAISIKISLTADIGDLINLSTGEESMEMDLDAETAFNYFLLVSKRSVKKKFHKLHMIVEASPKLARTLKDSLKFTSKEKEEKLLHITGMVSDIDETMEPMQKELEGYGYLVRPVKFKVFNVKYIDRYVKLKNRSDGYY